MRPLVIWNYGCIRIEVVMIRHIYAEMQCSLSINSKSSQTEQLQMLNPFWFEAKMKALWAALCNEKVEMLLMEHLRNTRLNLTFLNTRLVLFRSDFYTLVLSRSNFYTLGPFMLAVIDDCQESSSRKKMVEYDDDERAKTSMVLILPSPNSVSIPLSPSIVKCSSVK